MSETPPKRTMNAASWVLLVLLVGLVVGFVLALGVPQATPPTPVVCPPPPTPCPSGSAVAPSSGFGALQFDVVLGVLALALLSALLVVYGRTYWETKAPQILGLSVFLVALLLETVLTSPFVFAGLGLPPGRLEPYLLAGQFFECAALAIFLYLSLQ